jgi:glycosyltransferase involved in cell wall biosynthesis
MNEIKDVLTTVIPTYNEREDLLRKSIETMLNQTYPYIELIMIDDGCTDNTPAVLAEYAKQDSRVKVFRRERDQPDPTLRSVPQAFSLGLEKATGKWWHHDAADCWHEPDFAERTIYALQGQPENIIGAHTDFMSHKFDGSVEHYDVKKNWKPNWSAFENYMRMEGLGGMVFRMDICKKVGAWDWRLPRKHTREWTSKVLQYGDLVHVPKVLWHFVFHEIDQMKRIASAKYRILVDLKHGYNLETNFIASATSHHGRLAVAAAFRDFFTLPEWEEERRCSPFMSQLEKVNVLATKEASETWEPKI